MSVVELLTTEELAARLRVQPETVRQWSRQGLVPVIRVSRKIIRFDFRAVVEHLRRQQAEHQEGTR